MRITSTLYAQVGICPGGTGRHHGAMYAMPSDQKNFNLDINIEHLKTHFIYFITDLFKN